MAYSSTGLRNHPLRRTDEDEIYSVTNDATSIELVNTCDPEYQLSPANRVLVLNALSRAGLGGRDVVLADTLPADQYYGDNGINKVRIEAKKTVCCVPSRTTLAQLLRRTSNTWPFTLKLSQRTSVQR